MLITCFTHAIDRSVKPSIIDYLVINALINQIYHPPYCYDCRHKYDNGYIIKNPILM